ncbi:MAG TPA: ABC transporter ATP-binding protein [Actinomycetota bacterium]
MSDAEQTGTVTKDWRPDAPPSDAPPIIECRDVGIWFHVNRRRKTRIRDHFIRGFQKADRFWALRNVTFTIRKGESVGLIGSNGSGKSTLLKLIAGVLYPDEGEVLVHGGVAPLIELGAGFSGDLTARENVYLSGMIMGLTEKEIDARFRKIVRFSGLKGFMDMPLKHFSSGMKGRLGFSIVAQVESDVMLLDEVFAVGDRRFKRKSVKVMEDKLSKEGRTLVLVSHRESDLTRYCERTIWLQNGVVRADGPTEEVLPLYTAFQDEAEDEE